jgi:RHS repeat-associated protein
MASGLGREVNGDEQMDLEDLIMMLNCALSGGTAPSCTASSYNRSIYYAHNGHLGTPHMLSDENGISVWSAVYDPFGRATVNEDVDNDGSNVTLNFRFPGQYHDAESGLYYNYFRYYDPDTGRYITSDPIGMHGGFNTYVYVENNPRRYIDPVGLKKVRGRGGHPSMAGRGVGRAGVFGCLIGCVSYTDGDSEAQASLEPTIGGGFLICGPRKKKKKKTGSCEIDEETSSLYDPNGDNAVEFTPGYAPKGAGIGVSLGRDGTHCVAVGLFTGISVPVSINLGNLSE